MNRSAYCVPDTVSRTPERLRSLSRFFRHGQGRAPSISRRRRPSRGRFARGPALARIAGMRLTISLSILAIAASGCAASADYFVARADLTRATLAAAPSNLAVDATRAGDGSRVRLFASRLPILPSTSTDPVRVTVETIAWK